MPWHKYVYVYFLLCLALWWALLSFPDLFLWWYTTCISTLSQILIIQLLTIILLGLAFWFHLSSQRNHYFPKVLISHSLTWYCYKQDPFVIEHWGFDIRDLGSTPVPLLTANIKPQLLIYKIEMIIINKIHTKY